MKQRVLLTGGAGFIGSKTSNQLVKLGYEVVVLDIFSTQVHAEGGLKSELHADVEVVKGDVNDKELLASLVKRVDFIYHLAAETGVGQSMYQLETYFHTNVTGTAVLWQVIQEHGKHIKRVVLSSSRAIYGEGAYVLNPAEAGEHNMLEVKSRPLEQLLAHDWTPKYQGRDAHTIATPETFSAGQTSIYGLTKKYQEDIFIMMAEITKIPITIFRYFNVYGSAQAINNPYTGVLATFYRNIRLGKEIDLYEEGTPLRDFIHVDDIVRSNIAALDFEPDAAQVINLGTGKAVTNVDLVTELFNAMDKKVKVNSSTKFRVGDIYSCYADNSKMVQYIGQASVSLADGLKELVQGWNKSEVVDVSDKAEAELRNKNLLFD